MVVWPSKRGLYEEGEILTFMDLIWKNALKKIKNFLPKKKLKKRDYGEREGESESDMLDDDSRERERERHKQG